MKQKIFTLEKANSAIPLVRRVVEDIREGYSKAASKKKQLVEMAGRKPASLSEEAALQVNAMRSEIQVLVAEINGYLEELNKIGVELKDPQAGLIDFYCRHQNRLVYLCWRYNEERIEFWHELDAGVAGRKPISELQP